MRRILITSCAFASAALLIAGCGGKPWSEAMQNASPSARLLAAVTATSDAHTADFALDIKVSASGSGSGTKTADLSGTGSIDFTKQAAQMTLNANSSEGNEEGEMRVLGGREYIRKGGVWSANDATVSADAFGNADPAQYLHYLSAISSDVHVVGPNNIDGTDVTTYAGTIDLKVLASSQSLSSSQRETLQNTLDNLGANIPPMPFTAALDDHGRLRKLTNTIDMSILGVTEHIDTMITYSNFGVAVNITPPPGFENDTTSTIDDTTSGSDPYQARAQDRAAQSDLRNGLTAEKTIYTDNQAYTANTEELSSAEGSLDWGGSLSVGVSYDKQSVCLSEKSKSGTTFSIADVAAGADAGTYFGTAACPTPVNARAMAGMNSASWDAVDPSPVTPESVQSDLRNALTAEKTIYTDAQTYTADPKQLRDLVSSIAWGTKVHVYVGDATNLGDKGVVCISEVDTSSGKVYSIADVAAGPDAGTFFGTTPCPPTITPAALSSDNFNTGW
jgi:hypothetical protein